MTLEDTLISQLLFNGDWVSCRVHFSRLRSIKVGYWQAERVLLGKREIAESKMAALQLRAFLYYYVEPRFLK